MSKVHPRDKVDGDYCIEPTCDEEALVSFFHGTNGWKWHNRDGWLEDEDVSGRAGVRLERKRTNKHESLRVIRLNLPGNKIEGTLADIGWLSALEALNLAGNAIAGPLDPIARLPNLQSVDLRANVLEGVLPIELIRLRLRGGNLSLSGNRGFVLPTAFTGFLQGETKLPFAALTINRADGLPTNRCRSSFHWQPS